MGEENTEICRLKFNLVQNILQSIEQSEEVWEVISSQQKLCNKIVIKQVLVSDKFSQFHDMWMNRDSLEDIQIFHRFTEIEEEVSRLDKILDEFELKVQKVSESLRVTVDTFLAFIAELNEIHSVSLDSFSHEELRNIRLPDFNKLRLTYHPDSLQDLEIEWDNLHLLNGIDRCLREMEEILRY